MSLIKAHRGNAVEITCEYFCNTVLEQGTIVKADKKRPNLCGISGDYPIGVLLNNVVNKDLTHEVLQWGMDETQKGGKVTILQRGWVLMKIGKKKSYPIGHPIYVSPKGKPSLIQWSSPIGVILTKPDKDGYAKIDIRCI